MFNYLNNIAKVGLVLLSITIYAQEKSNEGPEDWGVGIGMRNAQIPFNTAEKSVADVIPLFFYKEGNFSIDGLSARYSFVNFNKKTSLNIMTRYRFFDIPKEYQNMIRGNAFDTGIELTYKNDSNYLFSGDLLFDSSMRAYGTFSAKKSFNLGPLEATPEVFFNLRTAEFNDRYYGLGVDNPGMGYSVGASADFKLRVLTNLYLLANIDYEKYDSSTSDISTMRKGYQVETFLGFGFMKDKKSDGTKSSREKLKTPDYLRVAIAQATPSNLNEILSFHTRKDPYENKLVSFSYGRAISDTLFGAPIQMYLQPIFSQHLSSDVQNSSQEFILSVKGYYEIKWPIRWRIGAAEGLSYVNEVTHIEKKEMVEKKYRESKMMNYLDLSLDFNLGSIFRSRSLDKSWLGAMIHHRSSIFESSSMFGRIKGGSNYIGAYYLHDF
jgi:outer membrane protein